MSHVSVSHGSSQDAATVKVHELRWYFDNSQCQKLSIVQGTLWVAERNAVLNHIHVRSPLRQLHWRPWRIWAVPVLSCCHNCQRGIHRVCELEPLEWRFICQWKACYRVWCSRFEFDSYCRILGYFRCIQLAMIRHASNFESWLSCAQSLWLTWFDGNHRSIQTFFTVTCI